MTRLRGRAKDGSLPVRRGIRPRAFQLLDDLSYSESSHAATSLLIISLAWSMDIGCLGGCCLFRACRESAAGILMVGCLLEALAFLI